MYLTFFELVSYEEREEERPGIVGRRRRFFSFCKFVSGYRQYARRPAAMCSSNSFEDPLLLDEPVGIWLQLANTTYHTRAERGLRVCRVSFDQTRRQGGGNAWGRGGGRFVFCASLRPGEGASVRSKNNAHLYTRYVGPCSGVGRGVHDSVLFRAPFVHCYFVVRAAVGRCRDRCSPPLRVG